MIRTALTLAVAVSLTTACDSGKQQWPSDSDVGDDVTPTDDVEASDTDEPSDAADDPSDDADDPDDPTDTEVMDDEISDSDWDDPWTESETDDTGSLLLLSVFGHAGDVDAREMAGGGLVFDGVEWYGYYNPYYYGDYVCRYQIPAWGRASQYDCEDCDWAADITFGGEYSVTSEYNDLCERMLGLEDGDTGTAYDGSDWFSRPIGFSSDFTRADNGYTYADVTVYYFASYGNWYPLRYSDYERGYWSWYYVFSEYYYY